MGADSDHETIVSSGTEDSEDADGRRDYVRGLAQRATEPDIKQRMGKGTFMVRIVQGGMAVAVAQPVHTCISTPLPVHGSCHKVNPGACACTTTMGLKS